MESPHTQRAEPLPHSSPEVAKPPTGEKSANEAENDKAEPQHEGIFNDHRSQAHDPPKRVIIVDDPHHRYQLSLKELLNILVQLVNVIAVFVFGVWAIRSYDAALQATTAAQVANALTMFALCQSNVEELDTKADALEKCYPILNGSGPFLAGPLQDALMSNLGVYATYTPSGSEPTMTSTRTASITLSTTSSSSALSNSISSNSTITTPVTISSSTSSPAEVSTSTSLITTSTTTESSAPNVTATSAPTSSSGSGNEPNYPPIAQNSGLSLADEISLIVGVVVGVCSILLAAAYFYGRRRKRRFDALNE